MTDHGHGHFDERAATWDDDPEKVAGSRRVADLVAAAVPLSPSTRLLEYGAGTGLLTQALGDRVGPVTLADTSAGMREVMARKVAAGDLPADARVRDLDLSTESVPDERFDLVVTVLALHHIDDVDRVLRAFAALLDGGGHLCVADLEAGDGSFHGEGFHGHDGFDPDALADRIRAAGFAEVRIDRDVLRIDRNGRQHPVFLAVART